MPASKVEQVLEALRALLEAIPDVVAARYSVLPEKAPDDGLLILRDGDPGEPEQALGGFGNAYYRHAVEIEVYLEEGDPAARDAAFDELLQQIGDAIEADPTLGGLARAHHARSLPAQTQAGGGRPGRRAGELRLPWRQE